MLTHLRPCLSLALVLVACGDSGGTTAGSATTSSTSPTTGTAEPTSTSGTTRSSGEPTTSAGTQTVGTSDDTTTSTGTTAEPDTTTTAPATATDDTTSTSGSTGAGSTTDETTGTTGGAVCGDGVVEAGETCDDGSGVGCDSSHDGGDGVCVPPGTCSAGHVLAGDDCVPELEVAHVHIYVSNTCEMMVEPTSFAVQPGQKLRLDYHNHSVDYPVDVWMHYNGGYTDLEPGATWMEQYEHCFGPNPSEGWAEISTACSEVVLPIKCL